MNIESSFILIVSAILGILIGSFISESCLKEISIIKV